MQLTRMHFSTSLLLLQPMAPLIAPQHQKALLLMTQAIAERFSAVVNQPFQHLRCLECYTTCLAIEATAPHLASQEMISAILEDSWCHSRNWLYSKCSNLQELKLFGEFEVGYHADDQLWLKDAASYNLGLKLTHSTHILRTPTSNK